MTGCDWQAKALCRQVDVGDRRACSVEDCNAPHDAKGYCRSHYKRMRRHGDPLGARPTYDERFEMRVDRSRGPEGCWLWTGKLLHGLGYGVFWSGREVLAHRHAYERAHGSIPEGMEVDHTCHNWSGCAGGACEHRRCVNPTHLEAVPGLVNRQRSHLHGINKEACKHGHQYTAENTYRTPAGARRCRECARVRRKQ